VHAKPRNELEALQAKYLEEIRRHKYEIQALEEKLSRLHQFAADRDKFFTVPYDKYRNREPERTWGLRTAVIDAVKTLHHIGAAGSEGVCVAMVANFLTEHGFEVGRRFHTFREYDPTQVTGERQHVTSTSNFIVSVHITLDRLARDERSGIVVTRIGGRKMFKIRT